MGRTLRELRAEMGWSQYFLSKQTKGQVPQSRISLIENNLVPANDGEKIALAVALDVAPEEIAWPKLPWRNRM